MGPVVATLSSPRSPTRSRAVRACLRSMRTWDCMGSMDSRSPGQPHQAFPPAEPHGPPGLLGLGWTAVAVRWCQDSHEPPVFLLPSAPWTQIRPLLERAARQAPGYRAISSRPCLRFSSPPSAPGQLPVPTCIGERTVMMADDARSSHRQPHQPGLEVVQLEHYHHPVPQVHVHESHNYAYLVHPQCLPEGYQPVPKEANTEVEEVSSEASVKKKRKTRWIIAATVGVILVIGAVVGGVVGSKNRNPSTPQEKADNLPNDEGISPAAMTATPTSVAPGLAPTALSRGYPHLEVYALTMNKTHSIYWKRRSSTVLSESQVTPSGREMELYEGAAVDAAQSPSVGIAWRRAMNYNTLVNRTEVHVLNSGTKHVASHSYHDDDRGKMRWETFEDFDFLSAPSLVQYSRDEDMIKTFGIGIRDGRSAVYYFRWSRQVPWRAPEAIRGEDHQDWHTVRASFAPAPGDGG